MLGAAAEWTAPPPDVEGLDRESEYAVRRVHFPEEKFLGRTADHEVVGVIFSVRDPRDVALSAWRYFTYSKDQEGLWNCVNQLSGVGHDGAPLQPQRWAGRNRRGWPGYVEDWLGTPSIRYEDHLRDPEGELTRVLEELGFQIPQERIAAAAEANLFHNRKRDSLMFRGKAGMWRFELEPEMVETIEEHCGDIMERLGYTKGDTMSSVEELRERVEGLKHLDTPGLSESWQGRRKTISEHILGHDLLDFLNWAVIRSTMFVGDAPYIPAKLKAMRKVRKGWRRWRNAMKEDDFGGALRLPKESWTSGNLINQGSHLHMFEQLTGLSVNDMPAIGDFAGGYGAMAKIIRRLGFEGPLATYEMPEMAALQQFYLENIGIDDVQSLYHLEDFIDVFKDGGLFISICGLSELPFALRLSILEEVKATAYLIVYGHIWDGKDNEKLFGRFMKKHPEISWQRGNCIYTHRYLIGVTR